MSSSALVDRTVGGLLVVIGLVGCGSVSSEAEEAGSVDLAVTSRAPRDVLGFVGTGAVEMTRKMGVLGTVSIGNHIPVIDQPSGKYTIQNLVPAADPDYSTGGWVVRRIAKLDGRLDSLGYSSERQEQDVRSWVTRRGKHLVAPLFYSDPGPYQWWGPDPKALIQADRDQIRRALERDLANGKSGVNVWEISNEPNLFPSITPAQYGSLFVEYALFIRSVDPNARIAVGALWSPDLISDKTVFRQVLVDSAKSKALAGQPDMIPNSVLRDIGTGVGNMFANRVLNFEAKAANFLAKAFENVPEDIARRIGPVDVSTHVYPFDARQPVSDASVLAATNVMLQSVTDTASAFNVKAGQSRVPRLYVTEFGNIVNDKSIDAIRARTEALARSFVDNAAVTAAFYYKGVGVDPALAALFGGVAPYTRLIDDPGYVFPYPADPVHPFPCIDLNPIGEFFYQLLRGTACVDGLLPAPTTGRSFDGNLRADLAFFEPGNSTMYVAASAGARLDFANARAWLTTGAEGNRKDSYFPGDFNGDGYVDLGFLGADDSFTIHFSSGRSFAAVPAQRWLPPASFGGNWGRYLVADFNGDRRDDLAFFEPADSSLHVTMSTGTSFGGPGSKRWIYAPAGTAASDIHVGDFNADGFADFLLASPRYGRALVATRSAATAAGFTFWSRDLAFGGGRGHYYTGDFTGDKRDDLIWATSEEVRIAQSTGGSFDPILGVTFIRRFDPALPNDSGRLLPADFNGDGRTDVGYRRSDNTFWVVLNQLGGPFSPTRWIAPNQFGHADGTYYVSTRRAPR